MRRILLLAGIILIIISCKSKTSTNATDSIGVDSGKVTLMAVKGKALPDSLFQITLNGIDSTIADTMKKHFLKYRGQDTRPIQNSVWFDIRTIRRMANMLDNEIKQEGLKPNTKGVTDGIRIYFVSDISIKVGKLKNSVILVSTKRDVSDTTHRDYYTHSKNDILFSNLDSIKGLTLSRQTINTRGEDLYDIFGKKDNNPCDDPHGTLRSEGYKMANQFGKSSINTKGEWFDLSLFRSLSKDTTINGIKADGIRIYFVKHPIDASDKDSGKEAFFITTTKATKVLLSKKIIHTDYFNCLNGNGMDYYIRLSKIQPRTQSGDAGDDKGELCPDNCSPGDSSNMNQAIRAKIKAKNVNQ